MAVMDSVNVGPSVLVKDPQVKGNTMYNVPREFLEMTQGLKDHAALSLEQQQEKERRPRMCCLYLEGNCRQMANCRSFHVDPKYVERMRKERGVASDNSSFITEVMVRYEGGVVAIPYNKVQRNAALEEYRRQAALGNIKAVPFCNLEDHCPNVRQCRMIHVDKVSEVVMRTPCCVKHGDEGLPCHFNLTVVDGETHRRFSLPPDCLAHTERSMSLQSQPPPVEVPSSDICGMHAQSRCKFGRKCQKLHVCRDWVQNQKLKVVLPPCGAATPIPAFNTPSPVAQINVSLPTPFVSQSALAPPSPSSPMGLIGHPQANGIGVKTCPSPATVTRPIYVMFGGMMLYPVPSIQHQQPQVPPPEDDLPPQLLDAEEDAEY
eukprot:Sspe_Gene.55325::Locus_30431_Transcript_1_1_Confidence_1.000_Length_1322::g.55325::m.55325